MLTGRFASVGRLFAAVTVTAAFVAASACSDADPGAASNEREESAAGATDRQSEAGTGGLEAIRLPRYDSGDSLRIDISSERPLFLYNVYIGSEPEIVDEVVELWPEDLLGVLGFQIVFPANPTMAEAERSAELERFLERTDDVGVPAIVQTAAFTGRTGPNDEEMGRAFARHPSLVGVAIAELSADYGSALSGLSAAQKELVASQITSAAANDAVFLWAEMGYFGPQVFVDAGADPMLVELMRANADRVVVQAKQNGSGRRFGTWSAAVGLFTAGLADNWGVNSEDWVWYEASFEELFGPQVPGGLTVAGMTRSDHAVRARLTYPEALFGTEMLVAAASGASVYSIEAPARGTVDPEHDAVSPAGEHVVFPLLRRLVDEGLIPTRTTVVERSALAFRPEGRDAAALVGDAAFSELYGPSGCTPDDLISCAQRQWLPSTGRYGIVPTVPSLSTADELAVFGSVVDLGAGPTPAEIRSAADERFPEVPDGDSWLSPSAVDATWFVANPYENEDRRSTFDHDGVSGEIGPFTFAVVTTGGRGPMVSVDNFRTDTSEFWATDPTDEELGAQPLASVPVAEPTTTTLRFRTERRSDRIEVEGAASVSERRTGSAVELVIEHRGLVTVEVVAG